MKLKNFLKLNFNNHQAEEYLRQTQLDEEMKKKTEELRLRAKFDGVAFDQVNKQKNKQKKISLNNFLELL